MTPFLVVLSILPQIGFFVGIGKKVGDGLMTSFWFEMWMDDVLPLGCGIRDYSKSRSNVILRWERWAGGWREEWV
jgi:hypothetical protein